MLDGRNLGGIKINWAVTNLLIVYLADWTQISRVRRGGAMVEDGQVFGEVGYLLSVERGRGEVV
jgi:hypothetical protein